VKRLFLAGVSLAAMGLISGANAADASLAANGVYWRRRRSLQDYACLDAYLDTDFFSQLAVLTIGLPITAVVDALKAPA
jgi:hypothetical protein